MNAWKQKCLMLLKDNELFVYNIGYAVVYMITIYLYVTRYSWPRYRLNSEGILITFWNEIPNVATIAPVVIAGLINWKFRNTGSIKTKINRAFKSVVGTLILFFYRVAVAVELPQVIFALVGIMQYALILLADSFFSESNVAINKLQIRGGILTDVVKNKINSDILGIQLFYVEQTTVDGKFCFRFKCIDHIEQDYADLNCTMALTLSVPKDDYGYFQVTFDTFKKIRRLKQSEYKKPFNSILDDSVKTLYERLKAIKEDEITKENSCEARLLIGYINLKKMLDSPELSYAKLDEGTIGIDPNIEKKLFTNVRTGLLGAMLFGSEYRYLFSYKKDGLKKGRQYCASLLNIPKIPEGSKVVCLTTISEKVQSDDLLKSTVEYIKAYEKEIEAQLVTKGGLVA